MSYVCNFFIRGRRNQYEHTNLLKVEGVNDKESSNFYVGKRVAFIYKAPTQKAGSKFRVVWGKITRGHGSNGVVRAKFKTNLPVRLNYHARRFQYYLLYYSPFLIFPDHIYWQLGPRALVPQHYLMALVSTRCY